MSFDDLALWLVTAMSLTAVFFLVWTFFALVRSSFSSTLATEPESARGVSSGNRYSSSE